MKMLYLIRGLPGSGKSTVARFLAGTGGAFSADDYFTVRTGHRTTRYDFDGSKLPQAHADCERRVRQAMTEQFRLIAVANTFTERWQMETYRALAKEFGYAVTEMVLQTDLTDDELAARNEHGVPATAIASMRARLELENCCLTYRAINFDETTSSDDAAAIWCDRHNVSLNGRGQILPEGDE